MLDSIVLLSGGIDSMVCASLLIDAGKKPTGVFVDYGQEAAPSERTAANLISNHFGFNIQNIDIHLGENFGAGEIVGRNLLLISSAFASGQKEFREIVIGIHAGVPYYDCTPEFVEKSRALFSDYSMGRVTLVTPLISWRKPEIIRYALEQDLPLSITYSCERGLNPPCGKCLSCRDRELLEC